MERALRRALRHRPNADLRVLAQGQFVIREGMVTNPAAVEGVKAASQIPGPMGFDIYLSIAPGAAGLADARPAAAVQAPMATVPPLHLDDGQRVGSWHIAKPGGQAVIVLRVTAGEQAPHEAINGLLELIGEVLD